MKSKKFWLDAVVLPILLIAGFAFLIYGLEIRERHPQWLGTALMLIPVMVTGIRAIKKIKRALREKRRREQRKEAEEWASRSQTL